MRSAATLFLLAVLLPFVPTPARADVDLTCGDTVVRKIGSPGDVDTFDFQAHAGEVVAITAVAMPCADRLGDLAWTLLDPGGDGVQTATGADQCIGTCASRPLPKDGEYRIRVRDTGLPGTGPYALSFEAVSATANGASNGPPSPTCEGTQPLGRMQQVEGEIDPVGDTDTFTFAAQAGEMLHIATVPLPDADGSAIEPRWQLFDPAGAAVPTVTGVPSCAGACDTAPLAASGVYTLLVSDDGYDERGRYAVELDAGSAPPSTSTSSTTTSSTSTTVEKPTTSTSSTTSTTSDTQVTTTTSTTLGDPGTTSTSTTIESGTTTSTTTTLPAGPLELQGVVTPPRDAPPATGIGTAVSAPDDRLLLGAPHADVAAPDAGAVYVVDVAGGPSTPGFGRVIETLVSPTPASGDAFGSAVVPLPGGSIAVGAPGVDAGASDAGAVYVLDGAGLPLRVITPPAAVPGGAFGSTLAVVGASLAIGAPGAGSVILVDPATGAAGVTLVAPVPQPGFGAALATLGPNAVVGAPGDGSTPGKVFVFLGGSGAVVLTLENPGAAPGDGFGAAVAVAGGVIVVGAPGGATTPGAVLVFDAAIGVPLHVLTAPTPAPGDGFGTTVAVANGEILVGASGDGGATYVFDAATGAGIETLLPPAGTTGFGAAVAPVGDRVLVGSDAGGVLYDGEEADGVFRQHLSTEAFGSALAAVGNDFLVGAPGAGTVSRVDGKTGAVLATILSPQPGDAGFGFAVVGLASDLAISSPRASGAQGEVDVFAGAASRLTLQSPRPLGGDQFGWALAAAGNDLIVGAPFAGAGDAGIVYLFDGSTGAPRVRFEKPTPGTGDFFGAAVAVDGDQVLVGAPVDGSAATSAGAVYLFRRDTAVLERVLTSPAPAEGDLFGASVAFAGNRIVVGAPLADVGAVDAGAAWVFDRDTGALLFALANPDPQLNDEFGHGVAAIGDKLVVGAPLKDGAVARDTGAVYVYDADGSLFLTLANPAQGERDHFGLALAALDGTTLAVGAPGPSRVYRFALTSASAGSRAVLPQAFVAAAARAPAPPRCGNGIVEGSEECDDGNHVDTDDCRNDCTRTACCTLDSTTPSVCDDGNPCTDDFFYPKTGCASLANDECCGGERTCASGTCRLCVGCFLYPWDCCDTGSTCLAVGPECAGTTCLATAYCQCQGGLECPGETVPGRVMSLFTAACDGLRMEESVAPDQTPMSRAELRAARHRVGDVRKLTKKAAVAAHEAGKRGTVSRPCARALGARIKAVKQSIPKGKPLTRCLQSR